MGSNFRCLKPTNGIDDAEQAVVFLNGTAYTLQDAAEDEVRVGTYCLDKWYIERKYKTQVAGLGQVYYEMRSELQELCFEELIFCGGVCIGAYHDALVFLFDDEKTHDREKYLGEMPTGPDQGIAFYDYYYLHRR